MWTCAVKLDFDKPDVGTATATFTVGEQSFTYSKRLKVTQAQGELFVAEAKAGLTEYIAQTACENSLTAILTGMFEEAAE